MSTHVKAGPSPQTGPALVVAADVGTLVGLLPLTLVSWLLPERAWPAVCRRWAPLATPMLNGDTDAVLERMSATYAGAASREAAQSLLRAVAGEQIRALLQVLRCHRPGGWTPSLELRGHEEVEAARARGRGAILWISLSIYCDLMVKKTFHDNGMAVDHLSRASHGFSASRFGKAVLNPIQTLAEDRYLADRVTLDENDPGAALDILEQRLHDNRLVTITVHKNAKRPLRPKFLGSRMTLAPGAPLLAYRSGAPLLPVFGFREPDGHYRVTVEPPIEIDRDAPTGTALERAGQSYAERLEPYVQTYPEQWRGWLHL